MSEPADIGEKPRARASGMAALTRLTLTDFRNYEHLMVRVEPAPVVLTGDNGAGKTNLLEAISLFAPGRGLRRAALGECARHGGAGGWAVACQIAGEAGTVRLGTGLGGTPDGPERQRKCRIDGEPAAGPGAFRDHVEIIWLSPAMDRLFTGPAGDRRRFLDRLVAMVDAGHVRATGRYERAMGERNRLLAQASGETAWLGALEAEMVETGVALAAARVAALFRLQAHVDEPGARSAFPPARLAIAGPVEEALASQPAVEVEDRLSAELKAGRGRDRAAGRALSGPHRSDLSVRHGLTGAAAADCSTGEQKALLISIILAKARLSAAERGGEAPVILLDEVTAHLDQRRRAALFDEVCAIGAQAWMTGTDARLFEPLGQNAQFLTVADGQVEA